MPQGRRLYGLKTPNSGLAVVCAQAVIGSSGAVSSSSSLSGGAYITKQSGTGIYRLHFGTSADSDTYSSVRFAAGNVKEAIIGSTTGRTVTGHVWLAAPNAAAADSIATAETITTVVSGGGGCTIVAQPDYPRKLSVTVTDADTSITAGVATLVGVAADGSAITEDIPLFPPGTTVTDYAYATLTSVTLSGVVGAAAGDEISTGEAAPLGLPVPMDAENLSVTKSIVDTAGETVGTVDTTAMSISPTTAPNATHNYGFYFKYTLPTRLVVVPSAMTTTYCDFHVQTNGVDKNPPSSAVVYLMAMVGV